MNFYQSILYGTQFYGPSGTDVPQDLRFYRTNTDNVYVFHWGFKELFIGPILSTLDFELQIDFDSSFSTPNLQTFTSANVIDFQNGDVRKGFAVTMFPRLDKTEQTAFARVRAFDPSTSSFSGYSLILQFTILEKFQVEEAENIINNLPDRHVYNKEDVLRPVSERNTLLYQFAEMYGSEIDQTKLETILTSTNITIDLCRDEQLFDNFGTLFNYTKPQDQEFVEYRECIRALIDGSLVGGTLDAIQRVIRCFTGISPIVQNIRDRADFFLSTLSETPPETPNGVITVFSTSFDYEVGSLQVLKNGLVQTIGVDFVENHATPGFDMTIAPLGGDLLEVLFDLVGPDDPNPVLFDLSDNTPLTGTITFTNGSSNVTAVGGAFLTELQPGVLITDDGGFSLGQVRNIIDDDNLVLTDDWTGVTGANASAKKINFNSTRHITGTVTFTNGSLSVSGVGSTFLADLAPGNTITDNDGLVFGIVDSISDNENLLLTSVWTGNTGTNFNARKLVYDDPVSWSSPSLAHGVTIQVLNPGQFTLDQDLLIALILKIIPAHVEVFFEFI